MDDEPQDNKYMEEALKQAQAAYRQDEVPIGAVIVHLGRVIAKAYNQVELLKDPTAHSEMIAITQATSFLSSKWLHDCTLYVTVEPCSMCTGALVLSRIKRICFGAYDDKAGACGSIFSIADNKQLNHRILVSGGLMSDVCAGLMTAFFEEKRRQAT